MTSTPLQTFRLPRLEDTFSVFPDNGLNPHYSKCRPESQAWISTYYKIVCGPNMRAFMNNCNFELVAAYVYPYAEPDGLRTTMDFMNIAFIYDEFTDTLSGEKAAKAATVVDRTLHDQDYDDGSWICHMMKDFHRNHIERFGPNVARRFIDHFCQYTENTGTEAKLRNEGLVLDIKNYICMRRESSALRVSVDLAEYCLGLDLPQYVYEDPVFIIGYNAGIDLVYLDNDLYSYNMEQAKGHGGANIVTVIMKSKGIDLQSAVDFLAGYLECLTQQFLDAKLSLASRLDTVFSRDTVRFFEAIGDWIKGFDRWSFATERYFGKENEVVKEILIVELRTPFQDTAILTE